MGNMQEHGNNWGPSRPVVSRMEGSPAKRAQGRTRTLKHRNINPSIPWNNYALKKNFTAMSKFLDQ